jgi:hypothetical protein
MVVLPHVLPAIAGMRKKGLQLLLGALTLTSLAAKVRRCSGLQAVAEASACCSWIGVCA